MKISTSVVLLLALFSGGAKYAYSHECNYASVRNSLSRTWSQGERDDILRLGSADEVSRVAIAKEILAKYPESGNRDLTEYAILTSPSIGIDKQKEVLAAARRVIGLKNPDIRILLQAYGQIADIGSGHLSNAIDISQYEVETAVACGIAMLDQVPKSITLTVPEWKYRAAFEKARGALALLRKDYLAARIALEKSVTLSPTQTMAYLFLAEMEFGDPKGNESRGIFYLTRATVLSPQIKNLDTVLREIYKDARGSEKGLTEVKELALKNTFPPSGFAVSRNRRGTSKGSVIAGLIVAAAAGYGIWRLAECCYVSNGAGASGSNKLMIFGGQGHSIYLGCLNCDATDKDAVLNRVGPHGGSFGSASIWNRFGPYGSDTSPFSACNMTAADPPVIVRADGTALGRLTLNATHPYIALGNQYVQWLQQEVCQ